MNSTFMTEANHAPEFLMFQLVWAYAITSTRFLKNKYKMDHNVNPREDIARFGEKAVESGKITREQLNMLKRNEASHANTLEVFPGFIGAVVLATVAKVPNKTINTACVAYTAARIVYHLVYLRIEKRAGLSYVRSLMFWVGNISCLTLFWQSRKGLY